MIMHLVENGIPTVMFGLGPWFGERIYSADVVIDDMNDLAAGIATSAA